MGIMGLMELITIGGDIKQKFFKKQKLKKNIIFVSKKGKAKRFINHK